MIIRLFKAKIRLGQLNIWQEKVEKFSIPWLKQQKGLIGYYPGKPLSENSREYSMLSLWESVEALKDAVGEDWEQVILLEDEASLVEETSVEHFEHFDAPQT
jgi:quinol monooxygenase YgiN